MQNIPEAPPEPKKSRGKTILLTVIATIGVLAVVGQFIDQDVATSEAPPRDYFEDVASDSTVSEDTSYAILKLVWENDIDVSTRQDICDFYNTPPVGTTPEMVEIFANGADLPYDEAERLLNQLLAEEC